MKLTKKSNMHLLLLHDCCVFLPPVPHIHYVSPVCIPKSQKVHISCLSCQNLPILHFTDTDCFECACLLQIEVICSFLDINFGLLLDCKPAVNFLGRSQRFFSLDVPSHVAM